MIEGFLEAVEPFQIRGWAYENAAPHETITVEILLGDERLAGIEANLFRQDLQDGKIGDGRHAFVHNFDLPQPCEVLANLKVRARDGEGWIELPRLEAQTTAAPPTLHTVTFKGFSVDTQATPVFILGAARSGTTAMAQALLQVGYDGAGEGHFFDLLATWAVALDQFRDAKGDDFHGKNATTAARFAPGYLNAALDELFAKAARAAFPSGRWIDKTPNSNMVHLAPRFLRIWPNARFIFMKRRFFENVRSRARKFPDFDFRRSCEEWAGVMSAWLQVRDGLSDVSVEIDQRDMARDPRGAASRVSHLLGLSGMEGLKLADALTYAWPERTGAFSAESGSLADMDWSEGQIESYRVFCEPVMREFGY